MTSQPSIFSLRAEESSGFLLWQVGMLWQRGIKKVLQPFDLTHPQFVLLASAQWFAQQGKEITQVSLANFTKSTNWGCVRSKGCNTFLIPRCHNIPTCQSKSPELSSAFKLKIED